MARYKFKDDVLAQQVSDEMVILEPESGEYFTVNGVGTSMIALLQQEKSEEEVAQAIAAEYEVNVDEAKSDFAELLNTLKEQGLIEAY